MKKQQPSALNLKQQTLLSFIALEIEPRDRFCVVVVVAMDALLSWSLLLSWSYAASQLAAMLLLAALLLLAEDTGRDEGTGRDAAAAASMAKQTSLTDCLTELRCNSDSGNGKLGSEFQEIRL